MTEAMRRFFGQAGEHPIYGDMAGMFEHGVRAFVAEVNRKALESDPRDYQSEEDCVGWAFRNLTHELLGVYNGK